MRNTRKCAYAGCKHNGVINIETEAFIRKSNVFFHEDCYKEKCDLELFRNIWKRRINNGVSIQDLNKVLNMNIKKGYSSEYLIFVIQYVADHNMNLKYPGGLKYYLDEPKIKEAYKKSKIKKIKPEDFRIESDTTVSPTFTVQQKKTGFGSILRKG